MHLALIETQGNQSYVFSSGREKAVRGGSELLYRSTTDWVLDAVSGTSGNRSLAQRAEFIRSQSPIGGSTYVAVATSGRAVLIDPDQARLESVVATVTRRALVEAPGLVITGAIAPLDLDFHGAFQASLQQARRRLNANITTLGPRSSRSMNLPLLQICPETGLAASEIDRTKENVVSYQHWAQINATIGSRSRLESLAGKTYAESVEDVVNDSNWRAVVHADGNNIGRLFTTLLSDFGDLTRNPHDQNTQAINTYRDFSLELEIATESALFSAAESLSDGKVMPILLGGDDIIVQVSAHEAFDFACQYLDAFERFGKQALRVLQESRGSSARYPDRLTSCAGVAIVKGKVPFISAVRLAGDLLDSAKSAKNQGRDSALDLHVSYESTSADLATIRGSRTTADGLRLWGGPYNLSGQNTSTSRACENLRQLRAVLENAGARSQIQAIKWAAREGRDALQVAVENALFMARGPEISAIEGLATEIEGHLLLTDALELADISSKVGSN